MKKAFIILCAAVAALTLASCDQSRLDIPQKGVYAEEDFYQTDDDCTQAIAAVYANLSGFLMYYTSVACFPGDDVYVGNKGYEFNEQHTLELGNFDDTHSYPKTHFQKLYKIVYRCNLVIDNFKDGTSQVMKQAVAEAKTIRSWAYIYLIEAWGNPPIVDHVLRTNDEFQQANATTEDLWEFVITSLDEAISSGAMQTKSNAYDKTAVRPTTEFAMALKGKAQVKSGDYAGAKTTLKKIIDSGKYELIPSEQLADLFFTKEGNHNCESIFETNINMTNDNRKKIGSGDQWYAYSGPRVKNMSAKSGSYLTKFTQGWQTFIPTYPFLKAMIEHEGTQSYRFKAWFWTYEDMQDMGLNGFNDLRTAQTQKLLDENPADQPSKNYSCDIKVDHSSEMCGIWRRKLTPLPDSYIGDYNYDPMDRRYFRYAEVLLLYAEACAQLGETSGDGLKALNSIAERAGAPTYSTLTLDNVKTEKLFEMWMEGTRFYDLVRWGDAPTVLADHWNSIPIFYGYKEGKSRADIAPDGRNLFDVYEIRMFDLEAFTGQSYGFQVGKSEYMPYPAKELSNNRLLVQNPGW